MDARDPNAAELGDWRIEKVLIVKDITQDGVSILKENDKPLVYSSTVYREQDKSWCFATPNPAALHLNIAWRQANIAQLLRQKVRIGTIAVDGYRWQHHVEPENLEGLYDYFEVVMMTSIASFGAIEAFCNSRIRELVATTYDIPVRGQSPKRLSSEEIELQCSTEEKLKAILPKLLSLKSPAGMTKIWSRYLELKGLRDAVTHFKRKDTARNGEDVIEPTALVKFLQLDPLRLPETAKLLICHFLDKESLPRWMRNPNWVRQVRA